MSGPESNGSISRLQVVLDTIKDEEWVEQLLCWHKTQAVREEVVDAPVPPAELKDHGPKGTMWKEGHVVAGVKRVPRLPEPSRGQPSHTTRWGGWGRPCARAASPRAPGVGGSAGGAGA